MTAFVVDLEDSARDGALGRAGEMIAVIEREFSTVRTALERERSACLA